ncbi:MAG: response regulator [Gemmatimonadales bacterium]|nr:response regulator [Gemmatimonadales bacterium]
MTASGSPTGPRPADSTILVVDDDPAILTLVERSLRAQGYRVWTATRAADARNLLAELAGAVDLVLTDIEMPGGLGSELARQIRSKQRWVRVLFMSSYSREDLLKQGVDVPEGQLLNKPFVVSRLVDTVRTALSG